MAIRSHSRHDTPARHDSSTGRSTSTGPHNPSGGYTLTELVLVLTLTGILGAIAAPRFFVARDFHERFFAREMLSALRYAQQLAVASGCEVRVSFNAGYRLEQRSLCRSGPFVRDVIDPSDGSAPLRGQAPAGLAVNSSVDPLIFDAQGRGVDSSGAASDALIQVGAETIVEVGETGLVRGS